MRRTGFMFGSCLIVLILGISVEVIGEAEEWRVYQVVGRELHNSIRAKHNAPPLKLNETLNRGAQEFAEHMLKEKTAKSRKIRGSLKNQQSFRSYPEIPLNANEAVKKAVTKWYSLINRVHWMSQNYSAFSALAWKGTTDLGIGVASNGARTIVVAAYSHPGNSELNESKAAKSVALVKVKGSQTVKIRPYINSKPAGFQFTARSRGQGIK